MDSIQYIGEHLWPGRIGHVAILLGFVGSLLAAIAYFFGTQRENTLEGESWKKLGRAAFGIHGISVFTVIGVIFYVMINKYYEYQYVQGHVSDDLPFKYVFAAFWEGQEGSFLLWMFWHVVLGAAMILTAKKWEAPTMSVLALIQVFLMSMILGVYVGFGDDPVRIGSNPTLLLREVMDAPIFASADYLSLISGTGLNASLQNYWMTIHPPTLFLGFASTSVPFCYAVAGLWTGEHKAWLRPALSWALFSGAILGTGILMGSAWAYEALSFGGYWAWDPVENTSLVPWLLLLAGIHTNLVANNTNHSIRTTYIFYILSFILVLYSTFLTRSGVLGETSVHAFTEMGLESQLILFLGTFVLLPIVLMVKQYRKIPGPEKEEPLASREFWMFIGSLVLFFSGLLITGSTSLPVFNKIMQSFDPIYEGRVITDPVEHFNKYQLWIAVFIGVLSGVSQFLRYKGINWKTNQKKVALHSIVSLIIAAILTFLTTFWISAKTVPYIALLFAGIFTVVANLDFLITYLKGNLKVAGSTLAHIGFGLMIVGIIASGLNKRHISSNPWAMEGMIEGADEDIAQKNIMLFKGNTMVMNNYEVTYVKDTVENRLRTYTVNYKRRDASGKIAEEFNLTPDILYDKNFTKVEVYNPSTKHYFGRDIFTSIRALPQIEIDAEFRKNREDSLNFKRHTVPLQQAYAFQDTIPIRDRDTFSLRNFRLQVDEIVRGATHPDYKAEEGDISIGAKVRIQMSGDDSIYTALPVMVLRGQLLYTYPVQIHELSTKIRLHQAILDLVLTPEEDLDYQEFKLKQGERFLLGDINFQFNGFNTKPTHPNYTAEDGDIAVGAMVNVALPNGTMAQAQPIYLIRENRPYNIKDELNAYGLHFRLTNIDPKEEKVTLLVAHKERESYNVPLEIATDSFRYDFLVLEAIEFPGINLFWFGSLLMMFGLGFSMWHRIRGRTIDV
ncbi:MAG: cytochrome c biogenesis protein CcsA [Saprospiraceae bacterium]